MLIDTSGLLCYRDVDHHRHADATTYFDSAAHRLTHSYVLAEFVALAQARRQPREPVLSFVAEFLRRSDVEVVWIDEPRYRAARLLLQNRLDKPDSLCDAMSFLLMQERIIRDALTTDNHFEQAGFSRLL